MFYRFLLPVLLIAVFGAACHQPSTTGTASTGQTNIVVPPVTKIALRHLDHAQPKLRTIKLWVGPEVLETELALQEVEVATGMMFRTEMGENEAMLFAFAQPYRVAFYMKNTRVPLSAAYIDPEGRIVEIHDLEPLNETPVVAKSDRIQYVLEVNRDWFKRHNIPAGTLIRTELGSLAETFN